LSDDAERGERARLFKERFRHWLEAFYWIVDVERCTQQDAFFKLGDAICCGDVKAVDGLGAPLPLDVIHDRLAQEFGHIFIRVEPAQTSAQLWRRPELVTYVFWEDLLRRWPQKRPVASIAGDEEAPARNGQLMTSEEVPALCEKRWSDAKGDLYALPADIELSEEDAKRIWGQSVDQEPIAKPSDFTRESDGERPEFMPEIQNRSLKSVSGPLVRATIQEVYDVAEAKRERPPNIKELPAAVQLRLKEKGYFASGRLIQKIGDPEEFKRRRRPPGKTMKSEQHALRGLK
jgi:hypothetical protein